MTVQKVPKVRIRFSERGLHLIGISGDEYLAELVKATGSRVEWRHQGDLITFEINEFGTMQKVNDNVWLSNELFQLLRAASTMVAKAVFRGYKKPAQHIEVVSALPDTPLFGALPRQEGPIKHSKRRTRVAS